jgi:hypothetical protein
MYDCLFRIEAYRRSGRNEVAWSDACQNRHRLANLLDYDAKLVLATPISTQLTNLFKIRQEENRCRPIV